MKQRYQNDPYSHAPQIEVTLSWMTVCKLIVLSAAVLAVYFTIFVGPLP